MVNFHVKKFGPRWRVTDDSGNILFDVLGSKEDVTTRILNTYLLYEDEMLGRWGYYNGEAIREVDINILFDEQ